MSAARAPGDRSQLGILERLLGIVAEVRPREGAAALLMFANIFLLLTGYYVLKTVREGLIIGGGGMLGLEGDELKIYAAAMMAVLLLGIVPAYGALASRVRRIRLLHTTMLLVVACLAVFFVLGRLHLPIELAFFLWLGIVNVFLIAQFWSYANDIYTEEQGKRLFAIIAVGGSLGAILGPRIAAAGKEHIYGLMLFAAALFTVCLGLYSLVNRWQRPGGRAAPGTATAAEQPLGREGGFQLLRRQRYLLLIALMVLVANLVNTTGEFILSNAAKRHAAVQVPDSSFAGIEDAALRQQTIHEERKQEISGFYGRFYSIVNLVAFLIQALLVSRIFKYLGVRAALFILPVIALGAYASMALIGGLTLLQVAKTAENSTDYSLQNTVRQALFLPTSREAKYKAKAAIDTFFVRFGDAGAAALVAIGIHQLGFTARSFALTNVVLVLIWILIAVGIARRHRALSG